MSQPLELEFTNVLGVYNALWDLGGVIVSDPGVGDHDNWLLTYREGLRGMLARLLAVDRHFVLLHEYQCQQEAVPGNPNEWAVECEYHGGVILFGMDSSLECFVFAMNALGFAKAPTSFLNITDSKALRWISPKNILGDPSNARNPIPGYTQYFPQTVALWTKNVSLLSTIFEYHDVSSHRSALVTGGNVGTLHLREKPKQPGSLVSSTTQTLQSLAHGYQKFMDELLPTALEEGSSVFGYTTTKKNLGSP